MLDSLITSSDVLPDPSPSPAELADSAPAILTDQDAWGAGVVVGGMVVVHLKAVKGILDIHFCHYPHDRGYSIQTIVSPIFIK